MKKASILLCGLTMLMGCVCSCAVHKPNAPSSPTRSSVNLSLTTLPAANRFVNLDYGVKFSANDKRASEQILKQFDGLMSEKPILSTTPDVLSFVSESARQYMRTMGFKLNVDEATDYIMNLNIQEFNVSYLSGTGWAGLVRFNVEVYDHNRQLVYPNVVATGRSGIAGTASQTEKATMAVNQAYANALADIDWDRIAYFLKKSSTPSQEANKRVEGQGNTSLESTIIRWFVDSSPKGADVSTRVVSSTPDVKNTNQNYVGTTPYETTESFDIKGLTFNNSGDVQIEITCEKAGYITQKKRFNLRQAIEQKEISTKFNLVKEQE